MPNLEYQKALPGLPRFWRQAGYPVLDWQRLGSGDERVYTGSVGIQHFSRFRLAALVIGFGAGFQPKAAEKHIVVDRGGAYNLCPPSRAPAPVIFHLPQPVLSSDEALGQPGVFCVGCLHVGNAQLVAEHLYGLAKSEKYYIPGEVRKGSSTIFQREIRHRRDGAG